MTTAGKVKVDDRELKALLRRMSAATKKDSAKLVKQSARRVAVNLARATNPFGDSESDKTQSENKIRGDISRAISSPGKIYSELAEKDAKRFYWILKNKTASAVNRFLSSIGIKEKYIRSGLDRVHQSARNSRGIVPKSHKADVFAENDKRDRLTKKVFRKIGLAKYGWAQCARLLGGVRGIPRFVTIGKGRFNVGSVKEMVGKRGVNYVLHNKITYLSHVMRKSAVSQALKREFDYLRQQLSRDLKAKAKRKFR
jgi:hypothetical protein